MKKFKNKGITLVALVITIIILLILAGISISALTGSGLFENAKLAKERTQEKEQEENKILNGYEETLNKEISGSRNDKTVEDYTTNLIYKLNLNNLESQEGVTLNGDGITVSSDNKYVTLDGNSYIYVSNDTIDPNSIYRNESDTTICCWYRTTQKHQSETLIIGFGEETAYGIHNIHFLGLQNTLVWAGQGYSTCNKSIDPSNLYNGSWHFIVGIWKDNNTVQLYYDSVPFSSSGSYSTSNTCLSIGGIKDKVLQNYKGDLSDIRVYNGALTEDQVKQLYKYGKNYLGID